MKPHLPTLTLLIPVTILSLGMLSACSQHSCAGEAKRKVVFASKNIPEGKEICTDELELDEITECKIPLHAIVSLSDVDGRIAKYSISSAQIVCKEDLLEPSFQHLSIHLSEVDRQYLLKLASKGKLTPDALAAKWLHECIERSKADHEKEHSKKTKR